MDSSEPKKLFVGMLLTQVGLTLPATLFFAFVNLTRLFHALDLRVGVQPNSWDGRPFKARTGLLLQDTALVRTEKVPHGQLVVGNTTLYTQTFKLVTHTLHSSEGGEGTLSKRAKGTGFHTHTPAEAGVQLGWTYFSRNPSFVE